jgi:hypothetical protein
LTRNGTFFRLTNETTVAEATMDEWIAYVSLIACCASKHMSFSIANWEVGEAVTPSVSNTTKNGERGGGTPADL